MANYPLIYTANTGQPIEDKPRTLCLVNLATLINKRIGIVALQDPLTLEVIMSSENITVLQDSIETTVQTDVLQITTAADDLEQFSLPDELKIVVDNG